jgi:hypothetical protein
MKMHRFFLPIISITLLMMGSSLSLMAQQDGNTPRLTPEQRAQQLAERQKERLNLSDDQYRQVLEIHTNHAFKHEEQRKIIRQQREQNRQMAQDIENSRRTELRKVLNEDQYKQLLQQQAANRERLQARRKEAHSRRSGGGRQF